MTLAFALLAGAAVVGWCGAPALQRLARTRCDPSVVMVGWLALIVGVVLTTATGLLLLVLPGHDTAGASRLAHYCWRAVRYGAMPQLDELAGGIGIVVLILAVTRFIARAARLLRAQRRVHGRHVQLVRVLGQAGCAAPVVLWLEHPGPMAYSIAGRPGVIVASSGLIRLPPELVGAVLAHERAHLPGRHHLLISLTEALAGTARFVPLLRRAAVELRLLVELAADAAATRSHGTAAVRSALCALVRDPAPAHALAMGADGIEVRLHRLDQRSLTAGLVHRAVGCWTAALTCVAAPAVVGVGGLLLTILLSC